MRQDLHSLRKKVSVFGWVGLVLLVVSILLNVVLLLRDRAVLPDAAVAGSSAVGSSIGKGQHPVSTQVLPRQCRDYSYH